MFPLAVVLLIAACGEEGSGQLVTESRSVGEFTAVDVSEGLRVEITVGTPFAVEADFDDNLLENLQIEVRGRTLHISCDPNCDPSRGAVVRITMPEIVSIDASAGSRVEAGVVSGDRLELKASAGSRINVRGSVDELEIDGSAGSRIEAEDLVTNVLDIDLSAGSDAEVAVRDEVHGELSAGSELTIAGDANPVVDVDTSAGSSVSGG
jgi:hypothetical protein